MSQEPKSAPVGDTLYGTLSTPPGYVCGACGAKGVKLWRDYNTFLDQQTLECGPCAMKSQKKEGLLSVDGYHGETRDYSNGRFTEWCDQIGWRVPAVPTEDGATYWGYTSVPEPGVRWWKRLPLTVPAPDIQAQRDALLEAGRNALVELEKLFALSHNRVNPGAAELRRHAIAALKGAITKAEGGAQ